MTVAPGHASLPADAPLLPPPPGSLTVINVSTAQELADACWNLASNQAIVIAVGTYDLASVVFPNGVDGRLTVGRFGAPPISNIQIRGATDDPTDVVLEGAGMLDSSVPFGFQIFTATDVLIANLSVGSVYFHAIAIQGDQGAQRVEIYNVRAFDAGQQIIKGIAGAHDVVIEYSELFYTAGAIEHPEGSPPDTCYTNGIDALGVDNWQIRDNLLRDINCQNGALAGPSVLLWSGSSNTVVERNTVLDSSRGIHLGLVSSSDHSGGVVRNNFVRSDPTATYAVDVGVYVTSADSKVLHNTVLLHGQYDNAIEVRFAGATNVDVRHNLADAAITARGGATPTITNNRTDADPAWFADETNGDLHLLPSAPDLGTVTALVDASDDFDQQLRPTGLAETELGADHRAVAEVFADGFESGTLAAWAP